MSGTDLPLTPDDVAEILALLGKGKHQALDIETARFRLRLASDGKGNWTQEWSHAAGVAAAQVGNAAPTAASSAVAPARALADATDVPGLKTVRPALPGTFYRSPKPGAPPFVGVGDRVSVDTVVCIVETMKLMNSVPAGVAGEVVEILVENGTPVEKGAALMRVRPPKS